MTKPRILVIDDDDAITSTVSQFLRAKGYDCVAVNDGEEAIEQIRTGAFPIIVSDIYIDRITGLDVLREARAQNREAAVILMTARGSVRTTVEAEMGGAFEYLAKPFDLAILQKAIDRAESSLAPQALEEAEDLEQFGAMVGFSPGIVEVYKLIARSARSDETVLITGETGVGKELVARAIHDHSKRTSKPFISVDAGAIAGAVWESELFGAVRGAYTGADRDRPGIVETARGGTVFLDEIGEVPLEFQPKLLRFLQEKEYRPVGSGAPKRSDVRVIAASNRPLDHMVSEGRFREDLYHRLNVLRIHVPPLRERRTDIPFLAKKFLREATEAAQKQVWFEPGAEAFLEQQDWPGNVRQLQNLIRRVVALNPTGPASAMELRRALESAPRAGEEQDDNPTELDEVERRQILRVLEQTGGNRTKAAQLLGIQRRTLYKKLARIGRDQPGGND